MTNYVTQQFLRSDYAKYLMRARGDYMVVRNATVSAVQDVYDRTARQIAKEVAGLTPGSLRYAHQAALQKTLERAAQQLNQGVLDATYKGIYRATAAGTSTGQRVTQSVMAEHWGKAEIKWAFAEINERAVLGLMARTYADGLKLSDRIWNTCQLARDNMALMVEEAVARGLDARKLAKNIQHQLQPGKFIAHKAETARRLGISKNVSYPAMRLARTEINNAFHEGCILGNKATPGYEGAYWRLSGQHPVPDVCDDFATYTGDGGNEPGFYKMGNEPFRPHPQCMCYLVPALEDPAKMAERLKQWIFDPSSDPKLEHWYQGVKPYLPRPRGGRAIAQAAQAAHSKATAGKAQPGQFKTLTEAQEWAEDAYPNIKWDFIGAHVDTINPTLEEFHRLAQLYPEPAAQLKYVGTHWDATKTPKGANYQWTSGYAHAATNGSYIGLNPKYYGDAAYFNSKLAGDAATLWHPQMLQADLIRSVMTHEYGHMVQFYYQQAAFSFSTSHLPNRLKLQDSVREWDRVIVGRQTVSRYALQDAEENWAETFMVAHIPGTAAEALPIVAELRRLLKQLAALK
jgi:hypothetical protein